MNLRLPASGSLLESLLNRLGASPTDPGGGPTVENVTEPQVGWRGALGWAQM